MTEVLNLNDHWVPAACTLPTAEQPLRLAEFDDRRGPPECEPIVTTADSSRTSPGRGGSRTGCESRGQGDGLLLVLHLRHHHHRWHGHDDRFNLAGTPNSPHRTPRASSSQSCVPLVSTGLRSGQVANAVGVNVETLRYYERRGIIAEPDRSLGHRLHHWAGD